MTSDPSTPNEGQVRGDCFAFYPTQAAPTTLSNLFSEKESSKKTETRAGGNDPFCETPSTSYNKS